MVAWPMSPADQSRTPSSRIYSPVRAWQDMCRMRALALILRLLSDSKIYRVICGEPTTTIDLDIYRLPEFSRKTPPPAQ